MRKFIFGQALLTAALAFSHNAHAQDYPSKQIRIMVPATPGGGADRMARIVGEKLWAKWGQSVVVVNRPGAAGNICAEAVFKAAPDGYTIMFGTVGPIVVNKLLYTKLAYDSDAFMPLSLITTSPNVLVVPPKVPADSVQQLIASAKANPGRLKYGSSGIGSSIHLTSELFNSMTDIKIVHVPYKGSGPVLTDLLGGRLDMSFFLISNVLSNIRAGTLRALVVTSERRNPLLADIPAMSELLPGFFAVQWVAAVAPPGTPPAIVNKLSAGIAEALKEPDVAKRLLDQGDTPIGSTPAEMAQFVKREKEVWGKVIRDSGAKAEE